MTGGLHSHERAPATDQRWMVYRGRADMPWYCWQLEVDGFPKNTASTEAAVVEHLREGGYEMVEVVPKSELDRALRERDEAREALKDVRDELSHGVTANWDYIDKRFDSVLRAAGSKETR